MNIFKLNALLSVVIKTKKIIKDIKKEKEEKKKQKGVINHACYI